MQPEKSSKILSGANINCFVHHKEVNFSNIVPSAAVGSFTGQNFDLALKSPSNITN